MVWTTQEQESGSNNLSFPTRNTAQGHGGNSENRKSIGEVDCSESWMTERTHGWIEERLEHRAISVYPSFNYMSTYLST